MSAIVSPLHLPCGAILQNRLVKAAMTERMSDTNYAPTEAHQKLYKIWAENGAGLLITGNVMIDKSHMESAGNVFLGDESMIPELKKWAISGKGQGNHIWTQISHSGRQTNRFVNPSPKAPSAVQLNKLWLFGKPKEMTVADIEEVIVGFTKAAKISKDCGFTGIQIHAAHGYLLSQFLSPRTNQRKDEWGGNLENRSRLLLIQCKHACKDKENNKEYITFT